jgi:pimeloyl-ACP methyl ester carboxylesterase
MSTAAVGTSSFQVIDGKQIEVAWQETDGATESILLLHEALGSVAYWRDFPQRLAAATGWNVLSYSRPGHGNSEGPLEERTPDHYFRQTEAVIPALLDAYPIAKPVLYGHSEGAGIAMLYAACSERVKALVLESPHVKPDQGTYLHVQRMRATYAGSRMQSRLALYHRDADAVFSTWADWVINRGQENYFPREVLTRIQCPVLVLQGGKDEFGTTAHMEVLEQTIAALEYELIADAGHLPHREQTDLLLRRVNAFLSSRREAAGAHHPPTPHSFSQSGN